MVASLSGVERLNNASETPPVRDRSLKWRALGAARVTHPDMTPAAGASPRRP